MKRRALLLAALGAGAPRAFAEAPSFEDFDTWTDAARGRAVPARVHWPRSEAAAPLLVFSHGIGGSRRGYSYLGQHLAAQGIASLHVQHVGSDRALWTGNVFSLAGRLQRAADEREALARVHDMRFALDRLLAERGARIDAARIAVAGHSYGANTSLLLAGAAVPGFPDLREPRFKAAVFISAPPLHGVREPDKALAAIELPSLHITCTDDVIRVPGYYSQAQERITVFEQTGSRDKWLAVFEGGSHSVFTDRAGTGGIEANPRIKAATKTLVAGFLQAVLDGAPPRFDDWRREHGSLLAHWRDA